MTSVNIGCGVGATGSEVQDLSFDPDDDTRDIYGNITYDAATGTHIEWNIINLPRKITSSDGILSEYTYLADGTKVKVSSPSQGALHYLGSMVFEAATPDGTPAFESLAFSDGRIVAKEDGTLEARYHITDHLGSVRAVVKPDGTVAAEHDYYPYGKRITAGSATTMTTALRHTFSGKEDQGHTPARAPYLDFGARLYSPSAPRWLSVDPMAEKYYSVSPYSYCAGNPVNRIDPDGKTDFFSNNGALIFRDGTDNGDIRIATQEEISEFKKSFENETSIINRSEHIQTLIESTQSFTQALRNGVFKDDPDSALKIIQHYCKNTVHLGSNYDQETGRNGSFATHSDGEIYADLNVIEHDGHYVYKISGVVIENSYFFDNSYNIRSCVDDHEGYHVNDSIHDDHREARAYSAQVNSPLFHRCTKHFKDKMNERINN